MICRNKPPGVPGVADGRGYSGDLLKGQEKEEGREAPKTGENGSICGENRRK